jgi:hypothetical protein
LGRKITGFAYPNGSHGVREIEFLKKHGYKYAFTTVPDYLDINKINCPYSLPRFEVYDDISFAGSAIIPLTSIRQPSMLIGAQAGELLMEETEKSERSKPRQIVFQPELVVRGSTKS